MSLGISRIQGIYLPIPRTQPKSPASGASRRGKESPDPLERVRADATHDSEGPEPLTLSYSKRNSDAPYLRFLPLESPGSQALEGQPSVADQTLPLEVFRALEKVADQLACTKEDLLLAGFAALLLRLTRQGNLAIVVEPSQLAVFHLDEDCSFRSIVGQAAMRTRSGEDSDQLPEDSALYQFYGSGSAQSPARSLTENFRLRFTVSEEGRVLELASPDLSWRAPTLRSWLGYLFTLIANAGRTPDSPIHQLPMWDDSDARHCYAQLNQTAVEFPGEPFVHRRFATQARRNPNAIAVSSQQLRYTYRELDEKSSELAGLLVAHGAGPGRSIAVCMERSAHLPMALLAVLKSGACYVPLDPHNPGGRLRSILEECDPAVLISDSAVAGTLKAALKLDALPMLCVDRLEPQRGDAPPSRPPEAIASELSPDSLAYTIYTSGSTGTPKGVRITHRALLNLICSMWRSPGITHQDRTLAVAPISFDIATMDMFLPLCSGGSLVIASRKDAVDPYRLAQLIKEHDITCMQATPATWRMMVAAGWNGKRDLKMISGGEALPRELANDLLDRGGELWNCYGPTETTIYSAVLRIHRESGIVPVGPPIANTSFYVLDKAGNLVPPGVAGELYIGGIGVSPGYINRPELNARRFVPDPFGTAFGDSAAPPTLFATGDLVRVVQGNQFEFFGRLDFQVKLRGFRIELGEIESVMRGHPAISDSVVVLREDVPGEPRLVAYVIFSGAPVGAASLREFASKSLPEYMLPSVVVALERFPLSGSGKIDRRALPRPESVPRQIAADHPGAEAAADELESNLLRIFRELLKHESIGVTDSFFQYGGYSLLTVRLFAQIDRELGVRLPISMLFDAPTVRDLARVIRSGASPSVIVPIRPYGKSAPIFLIQSYLLYNAILEIVEPDRPVYGVREMGDEREPMPVVERASKFAQEILTVCPTGPLSLAGWCAAGSLTVEIARQLREAGHDVGLVALFDAECPGFTLPKGLGARFSRLSQKMVFHSARIRRGSGAERIQYIQEAMKRNWDAAIESSTAAYARFTLWLKQRSGSAQAADFDSAYAGGSGEASLRPYPGRLNLFRAADIPDFSEIDATLGWSTIAKEGVKVNFVPGDHVSMFKKPFNAGLAKRLQHDLQELEASSN
jgi:amino acid adenylation domain-containing protein